MKTRSDSVDIAGKRFGRLTAVRFTGERRRGCHQLWLCRCECGREKAVLKSHLTSGQSRSCGCGRTHFACLSRGLDGRSRLPEYRVWKSMLTRCYSPKATDYHNYGGRGVRVCDRWRESFANFFRDMGPRPSPRHSIDRYPDPGGNYEPGNCRWATLTEQARNTRSRRLITWRGECRHVSEWAEVTGLPREVIWRRLQIGWSPEDALTTPVRAGQRYSDILVRKARPRRKPR